MTTFYCFPSEQDYIDAITVTTTTTDAEGNEVTESTEQPPQGVDVIGVIQERTGGTDEEPEFTAINGWHVNTPSPVEGWEDKQVFPSSPQRVFWGS